MKAEEFQGEMSAPNEPNVEKCCGLEPSVGYEYRYSCRACCLVVGNCRTPEAARENWNRTVTAADEITRLTEENERLRGALQRLTDPGDWDSEVEAVWTARTGEYSFRAFAAETLRITT